MTTQIRVNPIKTLTDYSYQTAADTNPTTTTTTQTITLPKTMTSLQLKPTPTPNPTKIRTTPNHHTQPKHDLRRNSTIPPSRLRPRKPNPNRPHKQTTKLPRLHKKIQKTNTEEA